MGLDVIVESVEKYLREFLLYLASFLFKTTRRSIKSELEDANKTAIFAILSSLCGAYLWSRYIAQEEAGALDVMGTVVDSLLRWVSYGIFLYMLLRLFRIVAPFDQIALNVVKVFAVTHVIAIYLAYIIVGLIWFIAPKEVPKIAYLTYAIKYVLILYYLPKEIHAAIKQPSDYRREVVAVMLFLIFVAIVFVTPLKINEKCYKYYTDNREAILRGTIPAYQYPLICQDTLKVTMQRDPWKPAKN